MEFNAEEQTVTCAHGPAVLLRPNEIVGMRKAGPLPAHLLLISAPPAVRSFQDLQRRILAGHEQNVYQKSRNLENTR